MQSTTGLVSNVSAVAQGHLQLRWWRWSGVEASMLFLALMVAVAVAKAWSRKKGGPRLPPGPRGVPVFGNLPFLDPNLHHHLTKLAKTYGPIIRLRLGRHLCIVVSSSSVAKELLRDQDAVLANHDATSAALVLPDDIHSLAWSPHGQHWRTLRRLAVGGLLSNARLEPFRVLRRNQIGLMVRGVSDRADSGSPLQLRELVYSTLYNVVTGMLWGGILNERGMEKVGKEFRLLVDEIMGTFGGLNLSDIFPFLEPLDLQGLERRRQNMSQRFHHIMDSIISRRLQMMKASSNQEGGDFLESLLRTMGETRSDSTTAVPITIDHIKGLLLDLVTAGMDTTTSMVEWAMSEMLNNPETMKKAQAELDEIVGTNGLVEETHLSKLPYLTAVLKETLRLRPAGPIMLPRTPSETCTAGGYTVPKGCRILVNLWGMQRDPLAWDEPSEFRPARFLINNERRDFSGGDFSFFPFGTGRRICPGALLADRMMMYALATLLHMFDWQLPEGTKKIDLTEKFGVVMRKAEPLVVVPSRRLPNAGHLYSSF